MNDVTLIVLSAQAAVYGYAIACSCTVTFHSITVSVLPSIIMVFINFFLLVPKKSFVVKLWERI